MSHEPEPTSDVPGGWIDATQPEAGSKTGWLSKQEFFAKASGGDPYLLTKITDLHRAGLDVHLFREVTEMYVPQDASETPSLEEGEPAGAAIDAHRRPHGVPDADAEIHPAFAALLQRLSDDRAHLTGTGGI